MARSQDDIENNNNNNTTTTTTTTPNSRDKDMVATVNPITPHEVVEKMSFSPASKDKQRRETSSRTDDWTPAAPPPASAPPPPPDSDLESVRTVDDEEQGGEGHEYLYPYSNHSPHYASTSYQQQQQQQQQKQQPTSRPAKVPVITHYGYEEEDDISPMVTPTNNPNQLQLRAGGDATIRPNIGQTNAEYGGIGSLTEVASRLRWMTVVTCTMTVLWEGFALPTRILIHAWVYPARVVLGGYLAVFSLLLLGVELNAPLQDNFGILYHPLGRGALLFLMSGMCFGILVTWWEVLFGLAFVVCGGGYIYTYIKYPEYRRWQTYSDNTIWREVKSVVTQRTIGWTNTTGRDATNWNVVAAATGMSDERQSLLGAFRV